MKDAASTINAPPESFPKVEATSFLFMVLPEILATLPEKLLSESCTSFTSSFARAMVPVPSSPVIITFPVNDAMLILSIVSTICLLVRLWWINGANNSLSLPVISLTACLSSPSSVSGEPSAAFCFPVSSSSDICCSASAVSSSREAFPSSSSP